ncbi:MAG TPA: hypothetical protein VG095_02740, partial [Chthoniobacterales bacterium]|nr:hypothetical protein [Chthoniobacterales bacterium]
MRPSVLVLLALFVVSASTCPGEERQTAKRPRVGIDTTFGDRFREAAIAFYADRWPEVIAKTNAALAMQPDPRNAAIL